MPFSPAMRRLLRLRESLERQEELELAFAAGRLHAAENDLDRSRRDGLCARAALAHELQDEVSGAELQAAQFSQLAGDDRDRLLVQAVAARAAERDTQRERWLERNRERKTLETLDQRSRAAARVERERKDQAVLDESFLLKLPEAGR